MKVSNAPNKNGTQTIQVTDNGHHICDIFAPVSSDEPTTIVFWPLNQNEDHVKVLIYPDGKSEILDG